MVPVVSTPAVWARSPPALPGNKSLTESPGYAVIDDCAMESKLEFLSTNEGLPLSRKETPKRFDL